MGAGHITTNPLPNWDTTAVWSYIITVFIPAGMYSLIMAFFSFIFKFVDRNMDPNTLLSDVPDCVWSFNTESTISDIILEKFEKITMCLFGSWLFYKLNLLIEGVFTCYEFRVRLGLYYFPERQPIKGFMGCPKLLGHGVYQLRSCFANHSV